MHAILQLDQRHWTYDIDPMFGHRLTHATGLQITIDVADTVYRIFQANRVLSLCCPRTPVLPGTTPDLWAVFWRDVEAAAGADALARFQRVHAFVREAAVVQNYTGQIQIRRAGRLITTTFEPREGGTIYRHNACGTCVQPSPLGDYQPQLEASMRDVQHIALPEKYGSNTVRTATHPEFWTHQGDCFWDIHFTGHERLHLVEKARTSGLNSPS